MLDTSTSFGPARALTRAPMCPGQLGGIDHLFQLRVTSIPQGTALILDSRIAVNIFRRWALEVQVNPYAGDEFRANQLRCGSAGAGAESPPNASPILSGRACHGEVKTLGVPGVTTWQQLAGIFTLPGQWVALGRWA